MDTNAPAVTERLAALGQHLREERYLRGLSLEELSQKADISVGLLSQIERGIGNPSYSTLMKLARALETPLASLFDHENAESSIVVRRGQRRKLTLPSGNTVYELLTPGLNRRVEVLWWDAPAGFDNSDSPRSHSGEETLVMIQGELEMKIAGQTHHLTAGDSIYVSPNTAHTIRNPGPETAVCVMAIYLGS